MAIPSVSSNPRPDLHFATDPILEPFLSSSFSATAYLNSTLPTWSLNSTSISVPASSPQTVHTLTELTTLTQTHLTTLDAKLARLSASLTHLTDDILRTGSRLGYEVEILGGDVSALLETLASPSLQDPLRRFSHGGTTTTTVATDEGEERGDEHVHADGRALPGVGDAQPAANAQDTSKPSPLAALHTLTAARARLQAVTRVFDAALAWPMAPSALPLRNQFVSVSGPAGMSGDKVEELEARAREWEGAVREEVEMLLEGEDEGDVEAASRRVQELRDLVGVWRGTVEERARGKFVEGLERLVLAREGTA